MAEKKFQVVGETHEDEAADTATSLATNMLVLGLKTLSQRALGAIADLFTLATVFSAFYLWFLTPTPNVFQIASLTIYAVFVLAANYIVRGRK